jgi:hypothetical protein
MSRNLTTDLANAVAATRMMPVVFAEFLFESAPVRFWSGYGQIIWNGETWLGGGNFTGVSQYNETQDNQAQGLTFSLSGVDSSLLAAVMLEPYQGRKCRLWVGEMDDALNIGIDPYQTFSGIMDVMEFADDGQTATITVSAENAMIVLTKTRERRYTPEDQRSRYPTDEGLNQVATQMDMELVWQSKAAKK